MKKYIYLFTLADEDVLESCNKYDKVVIYSTFIRQVLAVMLTFLVLLFGSNQLLPFWQALILSVIVSAIFFMIDQAIIGSEWQFNSHKTYFDHKWLGWLNGFINFFGLLIKFIPRLIYSGIIAVGLATLAEVSLQAKAIDRILAQQTADNNSEYFEKKEKKEEQLDTAIENQRKVVEGLRTSINGKTNRSDVINTESLEAERNRLKTQRSDVQKTLNLNINQKESIEKEITSIEIQIEEHANLAQTAWELAKKEETEEVRTPICGRKCEAQKRIALTHEDEILNLEVKLKARNQSLIRLKNGIAEIQAKMQEYDNSYKEVNNTLSLLNDDTRSVEELQKLLGDAETRLDGLINNKESQLKVYTEELQKGGKFESAEYDILDRYVGLHQLYEDGARGEAAKDLSLGLKVFFMMLELSAVLVVLFFSPKTVYSAKMRENYEIQISRMENNLLERKMLDSNFWRNKKAEEQATLEDMEDIIKIYNEMDQAMQKIEKVIKDKDFIETRYKFLNGFFKNE